jgi:diguanylate cyclase (GGDEF)-like protein
MFWQIKILEFLAPFALASSIAGMVYLLVRNKSIAARVLAAQLGIISVWIVLNFAQILSWDRQAIIILAKATYPCIVLLSMASYWFAIFYTGKAPRFISFVFITMLFISSIFVLLNWTTEQHGIIWKDIQFITTTHFNIMKVEHGWGYYLFIIYNYLLILSGAYILLRSVFRGITKRISQIACLLLGVLFPIVINIIYVISINGHMYVDFSPIGFAFGSLFLTLGGFYNGLFNTQLSIRKEEPHLLQDGLIVLDEYCCIKEINQIAKQIFKIKNENVIDRPITDFIPDCFRQSRNDQETVFLLESPINSEQYCIKVLECDIPTTKTLIIADLNSLFTNYLKFKHLAESDSLLPILNRRRFFELAETYYLQAHTTNSTVSILLFDVDKFKKVNDEHGHLIGDSVLEHIALIAQRSLRKTDLFGRFGGEEFIIFLPDLTSIEAKQIAERIRITIEDCPFKKDDQEIRVTISCGVASNEGDFELPLKDLVDHADSALYQAKESGRNLVLICIS